MEPKTKLFEIKRTVVETFQVHAKDKSSALWYLRNYGAVNGPIKIDVKGEKIKQIA